MTTSHSYRVSGAEHRGGAVKYDLTVAAPDGARSLAAIGSALGAAGVGLEGGGMWAGVAHYLIADPDAAGEALDAAGLSVLGVRPVLLVELDADVPGALGRLMTRLADAGVRLEVQYSDHDNRKVLVVDDPETARRALA
jgi:hypothetical protein